MFTDYSHYYDLLYQDKNYAKESEFIIGLINKYSNRKNKSILDVGCGTGIHDIYLAKKGYAIEGIDLSSDMIKIAKAKASGIKKIKFRQGNAESFKLSQKFDIAVSLFHVMSYQTTNKSILQTFKNIYTHLNKNGLFIFDFWYGPGVITDKPIKNIKQFENKEMLIKRSANPVLFPNKNLVDVNYSFNVKFKQSRTKQEFSETHRVRYFFFPELEFLLKSAGFEIVKFTEWMNDQKEPNFKSWNACIVAKKSN